MGLPAVWPLPWWLGWCTWRASWLKCRTDVPLGFRVKQWGCWAGLGCYCSPASWPQCTREGGGGWPEFKISFSSNLCNLFLHFSAMYFFGLIRYILMPDQNYKSWAQMNSQMHWATFDYMLKWILECILVANDFVWLAWMSWWFLECIMVASNYSVASSDVIWYGWDQLCTIHPLL